MAIGLPSAILPSNAPPWSGAVDDQVSARVLHEQSGNRQSDFAAAGLPESKYRYPSLNENGYPIHHRHGRVHQSQGRPIYHGGYQQLEADRNARTAIEARSLYTHILNSDGYKTYRSRQSTDDPTDVKGANQKWPEHLERAFFQCKTLPTHPYDICLRPLKPL